MKFKQAFLNYQQKKIKHFKSKTKLSFIFSIENLITKSVSHKESKKMK